MPYIEPQRRSSLASESCDDPQTAGELNFCITELLRGYVAAKGLSYQAINDVLGALEGAKLEFYRRVAVPYEEMKRAQNGDVYT